jgi:hypothetical protein
MVDWDLTETTTYCDTVGMHVAIAVYRDGSVMCSAYKKYFAQIPKSETKGMKSGWKKMRKKLKCEGPLCSRMVDYKSKLFSE